MMINLYSLPFSYIAVEFASIWRGMGSTVDLVYRKELPLRLDSNMHILLMVNFNLV